MPNYDQSTSTFVRVSTVKIPRPQAQDMAAVQLVPVLDAAFVVRWITLLDEQVAEQADLLTELDAAIGDADHGVNMTRGLHAARAALDAASLDGPAGACGEVGRALIGAIGGASGPLFGTVFSAMGRALPAGRQVGAGDVVGALDAALRAVQRLGAAVPGDKTMVDAIAPAVAALERGLGDGAPLGRSLGAAAEAAQAGALATVPMRARKGRASYLGVRSEGHQDPGATSSALLFATLHAAVQP
jgi:phosphoenolpyruvate---glycerone phosphotransferase subunit DhaL